LPSQQAYTEKEIPEEIRKHLEPWRQTLLEIMDKVKLEKENERTRAPMIKKSGRNNRAIRS
jgi:hypothetical protein